MNHYFLYSDIDLTAKYELVVANINETVTIDCNISAPNKPIKWIQTLNQAGLYLVDLEETRISVTNDGRTLHISQVYLNDEEYYGCAVEDSIGNIELIQSYRLFVRGKQNKKFIVLNCLLLTFLLSIRSLPNTGSIIEWIYYS